MFPKNVGWWVAGLAVILSIGWPTGDGASVTESKVWVYFKDHGEKTPAELRRAIEGAAVSKHALERRQDRSGGSFRDVYDLPPNAAYLEELARLGCVVKRQSRYLNAVSVLANREQIEAVERLPFVKKVAPVRKFRRKLAPVVDAPRTEDPGAPAPDHSSSSASVDTLDYGASRPQIVQINVKAIHDAGIYGDGVRVAILDTGFNRSHEALIHLDVAGEWDFIFDDGNTKNEPEDVPTQHNHGTYTLSTLAGFFEGELVGPAWNATFFLAKTERMFEEVQGEEDDYVAALEWADTNGAVVVSSSLGYYYWYTWDDMDGNTAVTTIAADIAASRGITVVTAAGNEGYGGDPVNWPGIIAPADGDSVIAVGAVTSTGTVWSASSRGPTRDGRIKPDVMARGSSTRCASPVDSTGYLAVSGTSLATPLVAGACALLLQMHPHWGPIDVLTALRNEASNSATPDNDYGWGIIDAYQSALNGATGVADQVSVSDLRVRNGVVTGAMFNNRSNSLVVDVARERHVREENLWLPPNVVAHGIVLPGSSSGEFRDPVREPGIYRYRVQVSGEETPVSGWSSVVKVSFPFALSQSYPNPFVAGVGSQASIDYKIGGVPTLATENVSLSSHREVRLDVYNVRGALVATLVDGLQTPDDYRIRWDGRNSAGEPVSSGMYFYRLKVDGQSLTRKMVLIRR